MKNKATGNFLYIKNINIKWLMFPCNIINCVLKLKKKKIPTSSFKLLTMLMVIVFYFYSFITYIVLCILIGKWFSFIVNHS